MQAAMRLVNTHITTFDNISDFKLDKIWPPHSPRVKGNNCITFFAAITRH
jgi:hypothetical protein